MENSFEAALREASRKHVSPYNLRRSWPAFLILILAVAASFAVYYVVDRTVINDNRKTFEKAVSSLDARFSAAVVEHENIVRSMQSLYEIYPFVVRDVFELYGSIGPRSYNSIQSIGFTPDIPRDQLSAFLYYARSERYLDYKFHPPLADDDTGRDTLFPVFYLVPLERNKEALQGFDMSSDPVLLTTLRRAAREDRVTASPFYPVRKPDSLGFILTAYVSDVEDASSSAGIRSLNVTGNIFIEVLAREFFTNAVGEGTPTDTTVVFECLDKQENGKELSVFRSRNFAEVGFDHEALFNEDKALHIADRNLIVRIKTIPNFGGEFYNSLPILSLIGALISSVLLFLFVISIRTSQARALDLADRMTTAQRRIVDSSKDMIGVYDLSGEWKGINRAMVDILGYSQQEFVGTNVFDYVIDEDREQMRAEVNSAESEHNVHLEVRMKHKSGEIRWISWNSTVSRADALVYSTGRDVTERKYAEKQLAIQRRQVELARQFAVESELYQMHFMRDISYYFRNSLTSIVGYLQMVTEKMYQDEKQRDEFSAVAKRSSEELLARVDDLMDVARVEHRGLSQLPELQRLPIRSTFEESVEMLRHQTGKEVSILLDDAISDSFAMRVNRESFDKILSDLLSAASSGRNSIEAQILVEVNTFENIAEIQMLIKATPKSQRMLDVYKGATDVSLIEHLQNDEDDIIFRLATSASAIRMFQGMVVVDSLDEENIVMSINLPCREMPTDAGDIGGE